MIIFLFLILISLLIIFTSKQDQFMLCWRNTVNTVQVVLTLESARCLNFKFLEEIHLAGLGIGT